MTNKRDHGATKYTDKTRGSASMSVADLLSHIGASLWCLTIPTVVVLSIVILVDIFKLFALAVGSRRMSPLPSANMAAAAADHATVLSQFPSPYRAFLFLAIAVISLVVLTGQSLLFLRNSYATWSGAAHPRGLMLTTPSAPQASLQWSVADVWEWTRRWRCEMPQRR
jgi:hypothetical protein